MSRCASGSGTQTDRGNSCIQGFDGPRSPKAMRIRRSLCWLHWTSVQDNRPFENDIHLPQVYEILVGKGRQRGLIHNHVLPNKIFIHPGAGSCPIIELPQSIRCVPRSFDHRSQLCPGDVGINCQQACEGCKAAVGSGDDIFAPNDGSIAFQALSD